MTADLVIIDDAPGTPGGLPSLWAWVAVDAMGGEGIVAGIMPGIGSTPLVTGKEKLARGAMAKIVELMPRMGRRYELRRYDLAATLEKLEP